MLILYAIIAITLISLIISVLVFRLAREIPYFPEFFDEESLKSEEAASPKGEYEMIAEATLLSPESSEDITEETPVAALLAKEKPQEPEAAETTDTSQESTTEPPPALEQIIKTPLEHVVITRQIKPIAPVFEQKINQLLESHEEIIERISPLFLTETEPKGKMKRYFLNTREEPIIEELYELWIMGYRDARLPLIFIHYFASIDYPNWQNLFFEMMTYKELSPSTRTFLNFLYQDLTQTPVSFEQFLDSYSQTRSKLAIDFSLAINYYQGTITRKEFQIRSERFQNIHPDLSFDEMSDVIYFFKDHLFEKASNVLRYMLMTTYPEAYQEKWNRFIEREAFYYGNYGKLKRIPFQRPEYEPLYCKTRTEFDPVLFNDLLETLKTKEFGLLHSFYIQLIHTPEGSRENRHIPKKILHKLVSRLRRSPEHPEYIPRNIRYIIYLYYVDQNDWANVAYLFKFLGTQNTRMIPSLYYARALFKRKAYERAWSEIKRLLETNKENLLILNEAAVYAYHSGAIQEAEKLFSRLRRLYPDNPQVLHNESVFLQYKAKLIEKKPSKESCPPSETTLNQT